MWMFQQIRSPAQDGNSEFNKLKEVQFVIQLNTFFNIYLQNSLRTLFAIFIPKGGSFTKKTCGWCWASQFLRIPMDGNYFQIANVFTTLTILISFPYLYKGCHISQTNCKSKAEISMRRHNYFRPICFDCCTLYRI